MVQKWGSAGGQDAGANPLINSLTLVEDNVTTNRFSGETFTTNFDMVEDGAPASVKSLKAEVTASFESYDQSSAITNVGPTSALSSSNTQISNSSLYQGQAPLQFYDKWSSKTVRYFHATSKNTSGGATMTKFYTEYVPQGDGTYIQGSSISDMVDMNGEQFISCYINPRRGTASFSNGGLNGTTCDLERLAKGESNISRGQWETQTNLYKYNGTIEWYAGYGSTIYRQDLEGNSIGSGINISTTHRVVLMELTNDCTLCVGKDNSSNLQFWWLKDNDTNLTNAFINGTGYYDSQTTTGYIGDSFTWEGRFYWQESDKFRSVDANRNFSQSTLPSGTSYSTVNVDPRDGTFYFWANNGSGTNTIWRSVNRGVSWTEYFTTFNTSYAYVGGLLFGSNGWIVAGNPTSGNSTYAYQTALYSATVTIPNDENASKLLQGTLVIPSDAPNEFGQGIISSITDNGATLDLTINGGSPYTVGGYVNAMVASGTATQTRFLVMDISGNVTSTTGSDPGFVDMGTGLSKQIRFPTTFPTGFTPDEELPEGTTLQVTGKAANQVTPGYSSIANSNIVIPGEAGPPPKPKLGITEFTLSPADASGPSIVWYNDSQEDISNTPNSLADSVWRSLYPWQNKNVYQTQQSFFVNQLQTGYERTVDFKFEGEELENRILEISVYCTNGSGGYNYYSKVQNLVGCTVYNNEQHSWVNDTSVKIHRLLIEDVTEFDVTVSLRSNTGTPQTVEYMAICAYRLTDIAGNEIETDPIN